jgi:hypothetical protein
MNGKCLCGCAMGLAVMLVEMTAASGQPAVNASFRMTATALRSVRHRATLR